jgi:uncharacterized repeat protein (TIGR01451 family)
MKDQFSNLCRYFTLSLLSLSLNVSAAPGKNVRLEGHIPSKALSNAIFVEHLDSNTQVPVTFMLPLRNEEELEDLIKRIYDPNDEHYQKYLTTDEFNARFAPSEEDYNRVIAHAKELGLSISGTHSNRLLLNAIGSAEAVQNGFNLHLHHYQLPNGRKFHAPSNDPEFPEEIAAIVKGVVGLDNHAVRRPYHYCKETGEIFVTRSEPNAFPSGPGGGFAPADLMTSYNLVGTPTDGSGQAIALFELASYQASDINTYTSHFNLPPAKLKNVLVDGGSGTGINAEVTLDIELALALAPQSEIYVYEGPNSDQGVLDTYNKIATDNIAKQVSTSWGLGENLSTKQFLQSENAIFQQMAAQGQSIYAAAGDSGAYDDYSSTHSQALVVDDPASQPYIVGVGGTHLSVNPNTGAYASESIWNNGLGNGAGGGGISTIWPIPSWQSKVATVSSKTTRNVPDVALNADTNSGYAIYHGGRWNIYGGTSCAAPLWAAFTARVNQALAAAKKPLLGFANPVLYTIGLGASYTTDFHDVTSGNNLHYAAAVGYDNASGWGSFNGANLFASLTSSAPAPTPTPTPPPSGNPAQLSVVMKHRATFSSGQVGCYHIKVTNKGTGPTSGPVTATVTLPDGLTYSYFCGTGWVLDSNTLTFTESAVLNPGDSYPVIKLYVDVNCDAPDKVAPSVTISGGGSASSTVTNPTDVW